MPTLFAQFHECLPGVGPVSTCSALPRGPSVPVRGGGLGRGGQEKPADKARVMRGDTFSVKRNQIILRTPGTAEGANTTVCYKRAIYFLPSLHRGRLGNTLLVIGVTTYA